jgi:hypothetical protein
MLVCMILGIHPSFFGDDGWHRQTMHPLALMLINAMVMVVCSDTLVWLVCDVLRLDKSQTTASDSESLFLSAFNSLFVLSSVGTSGAFLWRQTSRYMQKLMEAREEVTIAAARRAEKAKRKQKAHKKKEKAERKRNNLIEGARERQEADARRAERARKQSLREQEQIAAAAEKKKHSDALRERRRVAAEKEKAAQETKQRAQAIEQEALRKE